MVGTRNDFGGTVRDGHVVQAGRIDQVVLAAQPPQALSGLPAAPAEFAGRTAELDALLALLAGPSATPASASPEPTTSPGPTTASPVLITAVAGLAGVGKTTLALRAAHQARDNGWFPGGILFLDLRGHDTAGPVDGGAALAALLQELGVAREHLPSEPPAREALYRSRLAERAAAEGEVLVVLDNASSTAQVRPLLPAHPGNRALVTSRNVLADLAGARQFRLDVLAPRDALDLLATALRTAWPQDTRIDDDPGGARELAVLCGHLPLALRIAAAILVDDPQRPVGDLVEDLRDASTRLGELTYGDSMAVHAAFDLSYALLPPEEQRLFRLLALSTGPHVSAGAAAALLGVQERTARKLLRSLRRAHMVLPGDNGGEFRLHDLLRLYALDRAQREEPAARLAAVERLLDHYVESAAAAADFLRPVSVRAPGPWRFADRAQALAWLDSERMCLVEAVRLAHDSGDDTDTCALAFLLSSYLDLRKKWDDWAFTQRFALAAARRLGDPEAESRSLHGLGNIAQQLRELDTALAHYKQALEIRVAVGDRRGEAVTLNNMGAVHRHLGRPDEALRLCTEALEIHRELGHRLGEATTLKNLASAHRQRGDLRRALEHDTEALELHREIGDLRGQAQVLNNIGNDHRLAGDHADAVECLRQALDLHREFGDQYSEGQTLFNLGLTHLAAGESRSLVAECWTHARNAFADCGDDRESAWVEAQLSAMLPDLEDSA
ncbi:tetratricopeptide repeat protein [Saccharopolyspora erythraea]|uniref:ATP-binding protein n=1 Tax=Saccharopolyspora erythraea TaxID=1836 RepID=UPI001BAACE05|nr:tetratricopeptide repeat protein [Saccharopolyspora erythraea]QUH03314.1 tetratricopeptide repeat protein [Saccharopolyspora erythraea]